MANAVILQRVVAGYRVAVFERLYKEFGWTVVHSENQPEGTFLDLTAKAEWSRPYPYRYLAKAHPTWAVIPINRILRDLRPELVIAEAALGMSSTVELLARRRAGRGPRVFFWTHGYNADIGVVTRAQRLRQAPRVAIAALADGCLLYSAGGQEFLRRYVPGKATFVAPNTIDVEGIRNLTRDVTARPRPGWPHLVSVGRFTPPKRFSALVRIFSAFRQRFPDAVLTLVGAGPDVEAVKQSAGDLLDRAVFLPGQIYDEAELATYLRAADAYVIPGAAGLGVNHALAYGLPVALYARTARGPAHRPEADYVVDDVTGCVVPEYSDAAMVEALSDFFRRHPEPRRSFADSIARFVDENLTLDRMIEGFRALNAHVDAARRV